jgi:hypothetical protein
VLLVGGAALGWAADVVVRAPAFQVPRDFPEYWSAGRVNLHGGNPYDPAELLAAQRIADPDRKHAVMMWNPPPALVVYMPLGALPPKWAALIWVGLQLAAVFVACDLLWRTYGRNEHRWVAAVVALSFAGTWWVVQYGQNTGFLLLGLAGFLHFERPDRPRAAGEWVALTALKPHLLACFGVLLVAGIVTRRGWVALASGVIVIVSALAVALTENPKVVSQFIEAARHPADGATPLSDWALPVPAYWLRMWLAPGDFWVQFVPCALASLGCLIYRVRLGADWNWGRALPLVVVVSLLTTPYGGWIFDLPVLLVPVIWAVARLVSGARYVLAGVAIAGQAAITAASFAWPGSLPGYWWVAPATLAVCLPALAPEVSGRKVGRS